MHPRRRRSSLRCEKRAKLRKTTTADELRDLLREVLTDNMLDNQPLNTDGKPAVILVIGVNGVGKTTSIGKLAAQLIVNEGKKVIAVGGGYLPRSGELTSSKSGLNVPVRTSFATSEGADPAAVVYRLHLGAAKARGMRICIIVDTAGRLHNKANLMNELAKIDRVISRELPDAVARNAARAGCDHRSECGSCRLRSSSKAAEHDRH